MKRSLLTLAVLAALRLGAAPVAEWTFDQPGNLRGWVPNGHLKGVAVTNGALNCRAAGSDPILDLRSPLEFKATPFQQIEVRLKADRAGEAEFYWSNTTAGKFGGLTGKKTTRFAVVGDGQWHTYRLLPFWHAEGKIVRLRFDVYDGTQFALESIRITELPAPAAASAPDFDFTQGAQSWQAVGGADVQADAGGLRISATDGAGFALAPPVRIDADEQTIVSLRMAVAKGRHGTLLFATQQTPGLHRHSFAVEGDGVEHTYNLDLQAAKEWRGQIVALGLLPSEVAGAHARVSWLKASDMPL